MVGPGAVAGHALFSQLIDAVAGGDGTALVGEFVELAVEHHNLAVLVQQRVVLVTRDRAAAGGEHQAAALGDVGQRRRLLLAEGRLAVVGKDRRNQLARAAFDLGVGVDRLATQTAGQEAGYGRLACAAIADQKDWRLDHGVLSTGCQVLVPPG